MTLYNYTNTTLALLVKMGLLTEEAGTYLSQELGKKIHFDRYKQSFETVEELAKELDEKQKKFLAEPWMVHIRNIERQLEAKDKELTELKTYVEKIHTEFTSFAMSVNKNLTHRVEEIEAKNKDIVDLKDRLVKLEAKKVLTSQK